MKNLVAFVVLVPLWACCSTPRIAVTPVARTLADAIKTGKEAGVDKVKVEVAVAYGVKGGITIPIAIPISLNAEASGATKMIFEVATDQDVDQLMAEWNAGGEVLLYDPQTGLLTEVDG